MRNFQEFMPEFPSGAKYPILTGVFSALSALSGCGAPDQDSEVSVVPLRVHRPVDSEGMPLASVQALQTHVNELNVYMDEVGVGVHFAVGGVVDMPVDVSEPFTGAHGPSPFGPDTLELSYLEITKRLDSYINGFRSNGEDSGPAIDVIWGPDGVILDDDRPSKKDSQKDVAGYQNDFPFYVFGSDPANSLDPSARMVALAHELGHAAGLGHDKENLFNLMNPVMPRCWNQAKCEPHLTDDQRRIFEAGMQAYAVDEPIRNPFPSEITVDCLTSKDPQGDLQRAVLNVSRGGTILARSCELNLTEPLRLEGDLTLKGERGAHDLILRPSMEWGSIEGQALVNVGGDPFPLDPKDGIRVGQFIISGGFPAFDLGGDAHLSLKGAEIQGNLRVFDLWLRDRIELDRSQMAFNGALSSLAWNRKFQISIAGSTISGDEKTALVADRLTVEDSRLTQVGVYSVDGAFMNTSLKDLVLGGVSLSFKQGTELMNVAVNTGSFECEGATITDSDFYGHENSRPSSMQGCYVYRTDFGNEFYFSSIEGSYFFHSSLESLGAMDLVDVDFEEGSLTMNGGGVDKLTVTAGLADLYGVEAMDLVVLDGGILRVGDSEVTGAWLKNSYCSVEGDSTFVDARIESLWSNYSRALVVLPGANFQMQDSTILYGDGLGLEVGEAEARLDRVLFFGYGLGTAIDSLDQASRLELDNSYVGSADSLSSCLVNVDKGFAAFTGTTIQAGLGAAICSWHARSFTLTNSVVAADNPAQAIVTNGTDLVATDSSVFETAAFNESTEPVAFDGVELRAPAWFGALGTATCAEGDLDLFGQERPAECNRGGIETLAPEIAQ